MDISKYLVYPSKDLSALISILFARIHLAATLELSMQMKTQEESL